MRRSILLSSQAVIIALGILLTTVNCFCGTTIPKHLPCCCQHEDRQPARPPCPHCLGAMMTGDLPMKIAGLDRVGVCLPILPTFEIQAADCFCNVITNADSPPLLPPATLLRLHCALMV